MCRKETKLLLLFVVLYIAYLVSGALLFTFIERPEEERLREILEKTIDRFIDNHRHCLSDEELVDLLRRVVDAENRGVSATGRRNDSSVTNWGFGQSIFFAASIVTTIGYGNVTPLSKAGKLFCIGYASVGVVATSLLLDAVVLRLRRPTAALLGLLQARFDAVRRLSPLRLHAVRLTVAFVVTLSTAFLLPAVVFDYLEDNWTFFDAFYFCLMSLLTIGLGDYIPAENGDVKHGSAYKIGATVYLYAGLILVMLFVKCVYEVPELNCQNCFAIRRTSISEEDEEGERIRHQTPADDNENDDDDDDNNYGTALLLSAETKSNRNRTHSATEHS